MSTSTKTPEAGGGDGAPMTKASVAAFYSGNTAEQNRLHAQHAIGVAAFGGQLLVFPGAEDLLARRGLRVLDNAGADGFWLAELRKQLAHPDSAELVAADIAPYPGEGEVEGGGVRLVKHDMMDDWPAEWEGRFDLVHQRACVSFHPTYASAVAATRRLLRLVRPGGVVQLVDGSPPYGAVRPDDAPHATFFKSIGRAPSPSDAAAGIDPPIATRLPQLLADAAAEEGIALAGVGERRAATKWGKGAGTKEMEEVGVAAVEALLANVEKMWEANPAARRLGADEWAELRARVVEEARGRGFEIGTTAVWGTRKA